VKAQAFRLCGVEVFDLIRDGFAYRGLSLVRGTAEIREGRFDNVGWSLSGQVEAAPEDVPVSTSVNLSDHAIVAAVDSVRGISDDFMTSDEHHPGFVLIPTARFEQLCAAEKALS
jgi:hypothetical protein